MVGLNKATIAKYVREQEKQGQMMDWIIMKEAEDPFRCWLKGKYGLSWQIIPKQLDELMGYPDPEKPT